MIPDQSAEVAAIFAIRTMEWGGGGGGMDKEWVSFATLILAL